MDIDLLAKMVKEAILDHDVVTLPGVGCFVAELVPSSFSDKGYTINPPYRRLYFSPKQGTDTYLADLYARDNQGVDANMANRILTEFLTEMKEILKVKKTVVFPGLGRLRATRENHFFFVADEDLDIYPEGLGLVPLSLKTHVETPEEVATAVAGLAELIVEAEPEPVPEPAPAPIEEIPDQVRNDEVVPEPEVVPEIEPVVVPEPEPEPEPAAAPEPEPQPESMVAPVGEIPDQVRNDEKELRNDEKEVRNDEKEVRNDEKEVRNDEPEVRNDVEEAPKRDWVRILLIALGAVAALLVLCALLGRVAPGLMDHLLYSKEELEILRY